MATTKTDLCNMALSLIGDSQLQLTNVDTDNTSTSRQCLLHYDNTLEELVRMHSWNCALSSDKLTTDTVYPGLYDVPDPGYIPDPSHTATNIFAWSYFSELPSDCLRVLSLHNRSTSYRYSFKTEWMNPEWRIYKNYLLSNYSTNFIFYEAVPGIDVMDSLFKRAFYTLLAMKIVVPINGSHKLRREFMLEFEQVIMPEARRTNGFEGFEYPQVDSEFMEAHMSSNSDTLFGGSIILVDDI